jgi:TfoX/Sxy family transcriptional regulator of competence genes
MAYDEGLAQRVRDALADQPELTERKMFGGLCFLSRGNMVCGVSENRIMVRVGPATYEETLAMPHARALDFTGKPLRGLVYVDAGGIDTDEDLRTWTQRGARFAASLPPK